MNICVQLAGRIIGIRLHEGLCGPWVVRVGEPGPDHAAQATQHLLHDGLLIHRQVQGQAHLAGAFSIRQGPGHMGIIGWLARPLPPKDDIHPGHIGHEERAHPDLLQFLNVFPADLDDINVPGP